MKHIVTKRTVEDTTGVKAETINLGTDKFNGKRKTDLTTNNDLQSTTLSIEEHEPN